MVRRLALLVLAGLALSTALVRRSPDSRDPGEGARRWILARLAAVPPQGDAGDPYSDTLVRRHETVDGRTIDVFLVGTPARELELAESFRRHGYVREALAHYENLIAFHGETPEGRAAAADYPACRAESVLGRFESESRIVRDEQGQRWLVGRPAPPSEFESRVLRGDLAGALRVVQGPALERGTPAGRLSEIGFVGETGRVFIGNLEIVEPETPAGAEFYLLPESVGSVGEAERLAKLHVVRETMKGLGRPEPARSSEWRPVAEALLYLGRRQEALDLYAAIGLSPPVIEAALAIDREWGRRVAGNPSLVIESASTTTTDASVDLRVAARNVREGDLVLRRVLEATPGSEAELVAWLDRPAGDFHVESEPAVSRRCPVPDGDSTIRVDLPSPGTWLATVAGAGLSHSIVLCRTDASFEAFAFPARTTIAAPAAGWRFSSGAQALGSTDAGGILDLRGIPGGKCAAHLECCATCESCAHHHEGEGLPVAGRILAVGPDQFLRGTFTIDRKPLEGVVVPPVAPTVLVYTDRPAYRAGDTLHFRGIVRVPREPLPRGAPDRDLPGADQEVVVELKKKAGGTVLFRKTCRTGEYGTFEGRFVLPLSASRTEHVLSVAYGASSVEQVFEVLDYRKTDFAILLGPDPRGVRVEGGYVWGAPVEGAVFRCAVDGKPVALRNGMLAAADGQRIDVELVRSGQVLATKSIVHRVAPDEVASPAEEEMAHDPVEPAGAAPESTAASREAPVLTIRADREVYRDGDEIVLIVEGPGNAEATVVLGDVELYDLERVRLSGGRAEVRFPARGIHDPGVTAFAVCEGRIARADLAVRTRWMDVSLEAPAEARPGEEVEVHLRARPDAAFSLAAVDEAIFAIAEDCTPDLYRTFHPSRPAAMSWARLEDVGFEGRIREAERPIRDDRFRDAVMVGEAYFRRAPDEHLGLVGAFGGAYGGRLGGRENLVARGGGSGGSSSAVNLSLDRLARLANPDGSWSAALETEAGRIGDVGATGLTLLSFLGAGHTHLTGNQRETVKCAIQWLVGRQDPDGGFGGSRADQALGALALSEAYGMTMSPILVRPAGRAIEAVLRMQDADGGWSGLQATAFAIMALKSAKIAELPVSSTAIRRAARHVEERFRSADLSDPVWTRTSIAGCGAALVFLGGDRHDVDVRRGLGRLLQMLPEARRPDFLGWYLGTLFTFQAGGSSWKTWNASVKPALLSMQSPDGTWTVAGETVCHTALATLALEIYYRYERAFDGDPSGEPIEPLAPQARVRVLFPDTAFWDPELPTGAGGSASARFRVPDSITTMRLTARGVTRDGAVGEGRSRIAVRQPFFVQIQAPAFLVEADETEVRLDVHDETGTALRATVELDGYGARELDLIPGRPAAAVFRIRAARCGELRLVARATSAEHADAVARTIPVVARGLTHTSGVSLPCRTGGASPFTAPDGTRSARVSIHPEKGSLTKVLEALRYLHGYPYG